MWDFYVADLATQLWSSSLAFEHLWWCSEFNLSAGMLPLFWVHINATCSLKCVLNALFFVKSSWCSRKNNTLRFNFVECCFYSLVLSILSNYLTFFTKSSHYSTVSYLRVGIKQTLQTLQSFSVHIRHCGKAQIFHSVQLQ